jgi:alpha-tubulin suppressor-like RCC1 family protein
LKFSYGQIGDGTSGTNRLLPIAVNTSGVLSGKRILQISVGFCHTCVIADDENSYCWGYNSLKFKIFFKNKKKKIIK